jgi:hypothetical protein
MFFPPGIPVHENLATSYVLVDALVEDLCEGGFSGVIEVVLRNSDCHIVVNRGKVVAAVDRRGASEPVITTVSAIADRSRNERGRVSVVAYSLDTAEMVAARISAQPLYSGLTTEFADPGRMIDKLRREHSRRWLVELRIENGEVGLVSLSRDRRLVVTSSHVAAPGDSESAISKLIEDCRRFGGSFDVYFAVPEPEERVRKEALEETVSTEQPEHVIAAAATAHSHGVVEGPLHAASEPSQNLPLTQVAEPEEPTGTVEPFAAGLSRQGREALGLEVPDPGLAKDDHALAADEHTLAPEALTLALKDHTSAQDDHVLADELTILPAAGDAAEKLAEIKRLMGEIVRTIENASGGADLRDSFSLNLRAAQLKIADRFPFLDPFGSEFEYYAGEIAFVGTVAPDDFVAGLTEALRIAVDNMAGSSSQPARTRNRIETALRRLMEKLDEEFERYGLDRSIEIISGHKVPDEPEIEA